MWKLAFKILLAVVMGPVEDVVALLTLTRWSSRRGNRIRNKGSLRSIA